MNDRRKHEYKPDVWQVIKIPSPDGVLYKLFATWYGGYAGSDEWKLNSGITAVRKKGKVLEFEGYSGSVYIVPDAEACYRTNMYTGSVLFRMIENAHEKGVNIEVLPYETDWVNLV
jgi:hypothetical protein